MSELGCDVSRCILFLKGNAYMQAADVCPCALHLVNAGLDDLRLQGNKKVTDASMRTVAKMLEQLTYIDLRYTSITQVGLAHLQKLQALKRVCVCRCIITNPQLEAWSALMFSV